MSAPFRHALHALFKWLVPAAVLANFTLITSTAMAMPTAAPVASVALVANKGDVAWMLTSTLLVLMMALPGLALFYGGLVRSKNMLSVLMQVMVTFCLVLVLWVVYGYSLAFTEGAGDTSSIMGGFSRLFLHGITPDSTVATFSKLTVLPEFVFVAFQGTFAAITCALIVGAFAERAKFSAILVFMVLWFTFAYLPIAHMVWYWSGPDAYTAIKGVADAENAKAGLLWQWGALDFAGGTVVHINAGIAGLIGAMVLGKRMGLGKENMSPHSLTLSMVGACLLYVGWFGFNAGSALEANGTAGLAFMNTLIAAAAAVLTWTAAEWLHRSRPSMLGAISGAVAGLVAITPAAGNVGIVGALCMGAIAGPVCLWGVSGLKKLIGADDSLDVFGVHGLGGIVGALLTGVFTAPALGGAGIMDFVTMKAAVDYDTAHQVWVQAKAVGLTVVWSGVVSIIAYKLVDKTIGLRVSQEDERQGLDTSSHGESAYRLN
jgi:Amt family ammonium transporter